MLPDVRPSGIGSGYVGQRADAYIGLSDAGEHDFMSVGMDVNEFIDKSKDFIAMSRDDKLWVVDMNSLSNLVGHFGYRPVLPALGYSSTGDLSDIPCESVDGWKHPIYLRSKPATINLRYKTLISVDERRFKLPAMEIYQIEEIDCCSPVKASIEEVFPGVDGKKPNKFKEMFARIGKISDDMDIEELKRESATGYIYK